MRIILSAAVSADGCINDNSGRRLVLSSPQDWEQVHRLRAGCDAILIGAGTLRADNPSLVLKDEKLRAERIRRGVCEDIAKVVVSGSGNVDPHSRFFTEGNGEKILLTCGQASEELRRAATVIRLPEITAEGIEEALSQRGIQTLMVEGGSAVLTMFLSEGVFDEFRLAVSPMIVGQTSAPRLTGDMPPRRMHLCDTWQAGQMSVAYYRNPERPLWQDYLHLRRAVELGAECVPSSGSYCVGAVIQTCSGQVVEGYTHRSSATSHAEEEAIDAALAAGADLKGATMYSSMEPCSKRKSRPKSCSRHIIDYGFSRVFFVMYEPSLFVDCNAESILRKAGVEVHVMEDFARGVGKANSHLKI